MRPADARLLALEFRSSLFQAVDEGDLQLIPALGQEYCDRVRCVVQTCSPFEARHLEAVLKAPLRDGIRYLRTVRAHQSAAFRKRAQDKVYGQNTEAKNPRSTLHLRA